MDDFVKQMDELINHITFKIKESNKRDKHELIIHIAKRFKTLSKMCVIASDDCSSLASDTINKTYWLEKWKSKKCAEIIGTDECKFCLSCNPDCEGCQYANTLW